MMVKIMSDSKRIKGKAHFYVSILAGTVQKDDFIKINGRSIKERNTRIEKRRSIFCSIKKK